MGESIVAAYEDFYRNEHFVRIYDPGVMPISMPFNARISAILA